MQQMIDNQGVVFVCSSGDARVCHLPLEPIRSLEAESASWKEGTAWMQSLLCGSRSLISWSLVLQMVLATVQFSLKESQTNSLSLLMGYRLLWTPPEKRMV